MDCNGEQGSVRNIDLRVPVLDRGSTSEWVPLSRTQNLMGSA